MVPNTPQTITISCEAERATDFAVGGVGACEAERVPGLNVVGNLVAITLVEGLSDDSAVVGMTVVNWPVVNTAELGLLEGGPIEGIVVGKLEKVRGGPRVGVAVPPGVDVVTVKGTEADRSYPLTLTRFNTSRKRSKFDSLGNNCGSSLGVFSFIT